MMTTMHSSSAEPPTDDAHARRRRLLDEYDTESDDEDVAFASMDFDGVDFGGGDDDANDDANDDGDVVADDAPRRRTRDAGVAAGAEERVAAERADGTTSKVGGTDQSAPSGDVGGVDAVAAGEECDGGAMVHPDDGAAVAAVAAGTSGGCDCDSPPDSSPSASSSSSANASYALSSVVFPEVVVDFDDVDARLLSLERDELLPRPNDGAADASSSQPDLEDFGAEAGGARFREVASLFEMLESGRYADILRSGAASRAFGDVDVGMAHAGEEGLTMTERVKVNVLRYVANCDAAATQSRADRKSVTAKCIELEVVGIASLNLFLQLNYTGPSMDRGLKPEEEGGGGGNEGGEGKEGDAPSRHPLDGINPHGMFRTDAGGTDGAGGGDGGIGGSSSTNSNARRDAFHNAVLSELASDGEWPHQICSAPYLLLLSRAILSALSDPDRPFRRWGEQRNGESSTDVRSDGNAPAAVDELMTLLGISSVGGAAFAAAARSLSSVHHWSARAVVAHRRLISTRRDDDDGEACPTLWCEAESIFARCLSTFCDDERRAFDDGGDERRNAHLASEVMLEWGLAQHHFRKLGRGKASFNEALRRANLEVEVTGAEGKRTKYQQKATAQYLVRAKPSAENDPAGKVGEPSKEENAHIEKQMIKHDDVAPDAILLEKVKYEDKDDNVHYNLSILEQSILLALCLDVKNDNPNDGLTGEQMGGYLARVLNQHDDWMVYATALLERAWLECERVHGRERAILQIQALADQHSNRLTLTQSTFKSVEEDSAPAQDRLRHLHGIVYPPRWDMLRDLGERYAKIGVVTSAAEIFEELELWDDVVECYRIAGKQSKAEEVVRARLAEKETPRMHAALGDLTNDPKCFERSLELSNGKFYDAHVALGKYYFDKGDLSRALKHFLEGLEIKPLMPAVWFRVGTISMQLREWDTALRAFTEVVMQEPEEGDAWANVAAIHMHRKNPEEAYPALVESLKQNRNNWRVWVSKIYNCIDLKKYDEAIQACTELINLKARKHSSDSIPLPEEVCIRGIIGGSLLNYQDTRNSGDEAALDSAKRTLTRVKDLLDRLKSSTGSEPWLYEVSAFFNEEIGLKEENFDDLMKQYRTMQSGRWEEDPVKVSQMINLVKDISLHHRWKGEKEGLVKCKLLVKGVMKKIDSSALDSPLPEREELDAVLSDLEKEIEE